MDSASLSLAVRLMLEDLDALKSGIKGKGREDDGLPDIDIVTEFFREKLAAQAILTSDRTMCESTAEAVTKDADTIRYLDSEQAQRDAQLDDELVDKLKLLYPSSLRRNLPRGALTALSSGGQGGIAPVARCPCSHEYCRGCLNSLFQASTVDESLYSPRCCQQRIPLDQNRIFLTPDLVGRFKAKEMETSSKVYCHGPNCSTFVSPRFVNEVKNTAVCVRCNKRTCTTCKGATHAGDCPQDSGVQQVLELAAQEGWQRCYNCFRHALAEHNFAISVASDGRLALVNNGKSVACIVEPQTSSPETHRPDFWTLWRVRNGCEKPLLISG
ncbi:uncharacterized protein PpBr36_11280 [Pyricularia pennisetigena]|uniref:uncharacterized protein n=1 Tax=Pyricularia pennisetigena TaxID=1578925 RepID=UPI001152FE2C|nr:uncharacterized protein PpBr36_11280 [Pyricularia pennisetigena]TLS20434.1 hypothetical protein PpBr36_11280 [Pyricularia pennisetigena]